MAPVITPAEQASADEIRTLISALRKTCFFQHASDSALFRLAMEMERVRFSPGDVLGPVEGEPQTHLFVVTAGRLARRSRGRLVDESWQSYDSLERFDDDEGEGGAAPHQSDDEGATAAGGGSVERKKKKKQPVVVTAVSASENNKKGKQGKSTVDIMCPDRPGLVASVASALRAQGLSIDNSILKTTHKKRGDSTVKGGWTTSLSRVLTGARADENDNGDDEDEYSHDGEEDEDEEEHTAIQIHEVLDIKTKAPITDAARMRRVESAVKWALEKDQQKNTKKDDDDGSKVRTIVPGSKSAAGVGRYGGRVNSFGTLQCLGELPSFATTTAITSGVCWRLSSKSLEGAIRGDRRRGFVSANGNNNGGGNGNGGGTNGAIGVIGDDGSSGDLAVDIASGLAAEVFRMSTSFSTPLLDQPVQKVNVAAVSVAAAFEAYYRSALNSFLNASIASAMKGKGTAAGAAATAAAPKMSLAAMFPEMHVQIPTRVMYINGFKLSRYWLADLVEEPAAAALARGDERSHQFIMLAPALLPGVLMTPVSSILEACNAGHANPEPLARRWIRGLVPRCGREIIFGLGLNNLTDWAEERIPPSVTESKVLRNALGSVTAGVIAGYLSHVPHNLSTMKLLDPKSSYRTHVSSLVSASKQRVPASLPPTVRNGAAAALALLLPKGLGIRTTQVVGSFVLLNGISHLLDQR